MTQQPVTLTPDQIKRYSRHIIMAPVGSAGAAKAAGVQGVDRRRRRPRFLPWQSICPWRAWGTLGIVDFDTVDVSNLQRQILHQNDDVGRPKTLSAKETINRLQSQTPTLSFTTPGSLPKTPMEIISQYDLVVSGADNFPARYLINDACYLAGKAPNRREHPYIRWPGHRVPTRCRLLPLLVPLSSAPGHGAQLR